MRIIRGIYKSRRYSVPKSFPSRPTTDFAKEGLFNILDNILYMDNLEILDLCAGTGNISFEFLSREAGDVVAVDQNFNCIRHIQKIGTQFDCMEHLETIKSEIIKFVKTTDRKFDVIFADPPYAFAHYNDLVKIVFERSLLKKNGILIVEHGKETSFEGIEHFAYQRDYGNVHFSFFFLKNE